MTNIESQLAALYGQALGLQQQLAAVEAEINQLVLAIKADPRRKDELTLQLNELANQRQSLRAQLATVNAKIGQLQADINGRTSAGEILTKEQQGRAQGSNEVNPVNASPLILSNGRISLPPDTQSGSNAQGFNAPNLNTGINGDLRPITETQSVFIGSEPGLKYRVPGTATVSEDAAQNGNFRGSYSLAPQPSGGLPGVGAGNDDSGSGSGTPGAANATVSALNAIDYTAQIVPQNNVLDRYASYTYQASLYLCSKQNYQRLVNSGQKTLTGAQLLMQSGGANISDGSRDPNFDLDYYIDRIELKSFFAGKSVRLSHNVKEVRMTVIEPNGITLLDRLKRAVDQLTTNNTATSISTDDMRAGATALPPGAKAKNFTSQIYLLAIRFYGYDEQGNLVRAGNTQGQTTDASAFVEKWYPLILTKFNFKVASKLTEYDLEFKAPPYFIAASAQRATIPFNFEFSGGTVKDILAGPTTYSTGQNAVTAGTPATQASVRAIDNAIAAGTNSPPAKANAATSAKPTVRQGIMAAMNQEQLRLVSEGIYDYPDEYNVEFALDVMANATVTSPGTNSVSKGNTSMAVATTAADAKLGSKQSMDAKSRIEGVTAGTQLVQFIDTLLRNSSYIRDQQLIVIDENTGKEKATGVQVKNVSWYKIGFRAEAKLDQYDSKRQDYAYKITYVISPYKIVQLNSPYFPQPQFNGVHKQYRYWFTGQNTQVLSYEENLNSLYYVVMSGSNLGNVSSAIDAEQKFGYQTASGQASQGADAKTLEPAANAADQLYNPADLKSCKITIVGDPAWLQQGEALAGLKIGQTDYFQAFLADGSINFDSQQILFEVAYNTSADYDTQTGLMQINRGQSNSVIAGTNSTAALGTAGGNDPVQASRVYIAKQCVSEFKQGKFTQTLEGTLKLFKPNAPVQLRQDPPAAATTQGAKVDVKARRDEPKPQYQPVASSNIPAAPGTMGAALNALDSSYEGATILEAAGASGFAEGGVINGIKKLIGWNTSKPAVRTPQLGTKDSNPG